MSEKEKYNDKDYTIYSALSEKHEIEFKVSFMSLLYDNMKDTYSKLISSLKFISILVIAFELLVRASISEVDIGGFKLKDLSLIQKIIPLGISFMFYNFISMAVFFQKCNMLFFPLMLEYAPLYGKSSLYRLILPPSPLNVMSVLSKTHEVNSYTRIGNTMTVTFIFALLLSIPVFVVYSFYHLLANFGLFDIITWLSMLTSLFFILKSIFVYMTFLNR